MNLQQFEVALQQPRNVEVYYIVLPFNVQQVYGTKGQMSVKGTIDGVPYRSSIQPMSNGTHGMIVTLVAQRQIGKASGDMVTVVMDIDAESHLVMIPDDFRQALETNSQASTVFADFVYKQRRDYVQWISGAKTPHTRKKRIQTAIGKIAAGQSF